MWFLTNAKWSHDRNLTKEMRLKGWSKFIPPSPLDPPATYSSLTLVGHIIQGKYCAALCVWLCCGCNLTCCGTSVIWCKVYIRYLKALLLLVQVFSKSLQPNTIQELILQTASLIRHFYKLRLNFSVPGFPQLPVFLPSVLFSMSHEIS